jgi:hypothetical protein
VINADMRSYSYFTYRDADGYGQPTLSAEPQGTVKMAIYTTSQSTQDNINYKSAQYVGFTHAAVTDKFVIDYKGQRLKVLYVQPSGRFNQAFLGAI